MRRPPTRDEMEIMRRGGPAGVLSLVGFVLCWGGLLVLLLLGSVKLFAAGTAIYIGRYFSFEAKRRVLEVYETISGHNKQDE